MEERDFWGAVYALKSSYDEYRILLEVIFPSREKNRKRKEKIAVILGLVKEIVLLADSEEEWKQVGGIVGMLKAMGLSILITPFIEKDEDISSCRKDCLREAIKENAKSPLSAKELWTPRLQSPVRYCPRRHET